MNLTTGAVERHVLHGAYTHSHLDNEETILVKEKTLADPSVKAEIAKLELPKEAAIVADPWPYGITRLTPWGILDSLLTIATDSHAQVLTASTTARGCSRAIFICATRPTCKTPTLTTTPSLYPSPLSLTAIPTR